MRARYARVEPRYARWPERYGPIRLHATIASQREGEYLSFRPFLIRLPLVAPPANLCISRLFAAAICTTWNPLLC